MKFTLSWLKDHLDTQADLPLILTTLVNLGIEVESVHNPAETLKDILVGQVTSCQKHPNADRLNLCFINAGMADLIQVVCGAPNVHQGMKVAFAPLGTVIPATGLPLKKGKIRDVESFGMLCSARELNLSSADEGTILDLDTQAVPGTLFVEALDLNDPVIEVSLTPNRGDCFGVRGLARDLAAAGIGTLKPLSFKNRQDAECDLLSVHITADSGCTHFSGLIMEGIKNTQSPPWVQQRLKAAGLRCINALVDVTNYLSLDLCRPLHVFDADRIKGNLHVRLSKQGEALKGLDEKTYILDNKMTVISDDTGVLALGGIMGGVGSGCTEETTRVFIECAMFDPIQTAKTGRKLGVLSEARTRFERGIDPHSQTYGLWAAAQLIQEWCGGHIKGRAKIIHESASIAPQPLKITLAKEKLRSLSGHPFTLEEATSYLEKLEFTICPQINELSGDQITVIPPAFRHDIKNTVDLIEEIIRLRGYDCIDPAPLPVIPLSSGSFSIAQVAQRCMAGRGFQETITWSFMDEKQAHLFGWTCEKLRLSNPISQDLSVMRPSLLPNLCQAVARNESRGNAHVALVEMGPQYDSEGQETRQKKMISGVRSGSLPKSWNSTARMVDVFDVKADVFALLTALGIQEQSLTVDPSAAPDYYHPGRKGGVFQGNRLMAYFGQLHPTVCQAVESSQELVGFEVFLDEIPLPKTKKSSLTLSPYQPVVRDFAFIVDENFLADKILKAIAKVDRPLISSSTVFDVYTGEGIPLGKKSLAIQVRFDPYKGTMGEEDIQILCTKIIEAVEKTGGVLRTL